MPQKINLDKVPEKLKSDREAIELNFVFSMFLEPDRVKDYKNIVNDVDVVTEDAVFYYGLIQGIVNSGFNEITDHAIATYLESRPALKKYYEKKGGFSGVKHVVECLSEDNLGKYHDDLVRSNLMIHLYNKKFPILDDYDKLINMDANQIIDFYTYQLNNIDLDSLEKIKVMDLSVGNDEWIKKINTGYLNGFPIDSPIINYMLSGIHPDNLTLHIAGIGQGKTTTAILLYVFSMIKESDVTIISNEQGADEFRSMLMSATLFNKVKNVRGMNRQKFIRGGFDEDQLDRLHEASQWLENQPGHVKFVEMQDYEVNNIKKVVRRQSALGCQLFIVDTIKPMNEMDDRAWAQFSEVAKTLFLLAKETHTAIICTAQASAESLGRKYMDLTSIAKSRAIAETATQVIGFRPVFPDEIEHIHPYNWDYKNNPGSEKVKKENDLDPDKHYVIFYIMKNRFGPTMPQVVCEFDQAFCKLREVGYYVSTYSAPRGR